GEGDGGFLHRCDHRRDRRQPGDRAAVQKCDRDRLGHPPPLLGVERTRRQDCTMLVDQNNIVAIFSPLRASRAKSRTPRSSAAARRRRTTGAWSVTMKPEAGKRARQAKSVSRMEPSRLQAELAARILRRMKELGAGAGYHLVELELCELFGVSR